MQVSSFNLVSKLGQAIAPGEGHIHYYLDAEPPTASDRPAVSAPGTYAASTETSYTWRNVSPGSHTFAVQLVNNNHTPLSTPVIAKVTVTVPSPQAQSVSINLTALNRAFDKRTITVPAGANVAVVFNNGDSMPHNVAIYETREGTNPIFVGGIITGPTTTTYRFVAPATPGTYFFRCNVHPTSMTGSFVVTSP